MHFTTLAASAAVVGSALAGVYYEEPVYYTTTAAAYPHETKVYTSVSTCTEKPVYHTTAAPYSPPAYHSPAVHDDYVVTYTSYEHITVTACPDYVKYCPAKVYTSTVYGYSTCKGSSPEPTDVPYYVPPANTTDYYVPPVYETPEPYPTYTQTYYSHGIVYTTTYCPGPKSTPVYYSPVYTPTTTYCPPTKTPVYTPPVYSTPVYYPPHNQTTPTYNPPPSYTGAASSNAVSFGVAAVAGLVALFIAA